MKYKEKKSNITEYKQKEIQGKKPIACMLTPYKEEHGGSSSWWGRERSSTMDGGQRKPARRRSAETTKKKKNSKNTETDRKVIQQNTKTKTGMEEVGDEEKGRGHRV
jgi:hypothetical protein